MPVRDTSTEAYTDIQESGILSAQLKRIHEALLEHGPCTAQELLFKTGWDQRKLNSVQTNIPSKLHFLVNTYGIAKEKEKRLCQIKKRRAIVYEALEVKPVKKPKTELKKINPVAFAQDVKEALLIGPMTEMNDRMEVVYQRHLKLSWKKIIVGNKKRPRSEDQAEFDV